MSKPIVSVTQFPERGTVVLAQRGDGRVHLFVPSEDAVLDARDVSVLIENLEKARDGRLWEEAE